MPRAKKEPKPVYPSRAKLKYVPFPKDMWQELQRIGKADERSVAYMLRLAVKEFLERNGS
jgi:hypothetical protein